MPIGEVIREHRKKKNLTQEELAKRLGVTTPAVNKWERGVSQPDIQLLCPLARLLDVTPDTLLSFEKELTTEEINGLIAEMDTMFINAPYAEVFAWAKGNMERYPNSAQLIWQLAVVLDARRLFDGVENADIYDGDVEAWYLRALESGDEGVKSHAADSLYGFYLRKKQYDKAENCLAYFSEQNPERKRKQADLFARTGRKEQAYKAYEELLFSGYQVLSMVLQSLYALAMKDEDRERARALIEKQCQLANVFEMGRYHEVAPRLELSTLEQDADATLTIMEEMLSSADQICAFAKAPLYAHMAFKDVRAAFIEKLKVDLLDGFRDEETYGYLKGDPRWEALTGRKAQM